MTCIRTNWPKHKAPARKRFDYTGRRQRSPVTLPKLNFMDAKSEADYLIDLLEQCRTREIGNVEEANNAARRQVKGTAKD